MSAIELFDSGPLAGPDQATYTGGITGVFILYAEIITLPPWVGVSFYGGSNATLAKAAELLAPASLMPHLGVFWEGIFNIPGAGELAASEYLEPMTRIAQSTRYQTGPGTDPRFIYLDIPSGFTARLKVFADA